MDWLTWLLLRWLLFIPEKCSSSDIFSCRRKVQQCMFKCHLPDLCISTFSSRQNLWSGFGPLRCLTRHRHTSMGPLGFPSHGVQSWWLCVHNFVCLLTSLDLNFYHYFFKIHFCMLMLYSWQIQWELYRAVWESRKGGHAANDHKWESNPGRCHKDWSLMVHSPLIAPKN